MEYKQTILELLTKLGDRDTQEGALRALRDAASTCGEAAGKGRRAAAAEAPTVNAATNAGIPLAALAELQAFVACLCSSFHSEPRASARAAMVSLFASLCARRRGEAVSRVAGSGQLVSRIVVAIVKRLRDKHCLVRDSGVRALESIAEAIRLGSREAPGSALSVAHFLKPLMEAVSEQNMYYQGGQEEREREEAEAKFGDLGCNECV